MLKVTIRQGTPPYVEAEGETKVLAAECCAVIGGVYHQLKSMDEGAAQAFRACVMRLMTRPDSPLWEKSPVVFGFGFQKRDGYGKD